MAGYKISYSNILFSPSKIDQRGIYHKLGYIVLAHIWFLRTVPRGVTITKDGIFFNNAHLLWILVRKLYREPSLISLLASILVKGLQLRHMESPNRRYAIT